MSPAPTTLQRSTAPNHSGASDTALLVEVRKGDRYAYAEIYRRYEGDAKAYARSLVGRSDADDVVAEAFTKMLNALQRGNGPVDNPVKYLMVAVRSAAANLRNRTSRERATSERLHGQEPVTDGALTEADENLIRAFRSLSPKRRQVLWWAEIEGLGPKVIGDRLGINAAAASALAYRARVELRAAHRAELAAAASFEDRVAGTAS